MEYYYPYLSDRYRSTFIDFLVILGFMALVSIILSFFNNIPDTVRIVCFSLIFLYEPVCVSLGGTIGNYSTKIRVRNSANPTKKLNIFLAIFRSAVKYMLGIISLLFIHTNPKRKAIHDFISGSVVI